MLLKQLELNGFKSFARPISLSFATPITAVVGPNGSGKSNIVEALRFVLGEQSIKSLRGKRGEDLIFNGSSRVARMNRGSVSVTFDNRKRIFDIDFDEVEVKRVIHRDSTSQYLLNGSPVRLKDVVELLSAVHIGASSHHIIAQGETDRILNASIKERRMMIEDALGLRIYHAKRQEGERKLTKTEENIAQAQGLRKEIAPHLRFLEKQVEKIRQAEEYRTELKERYREYLHIENVLLGKKRREIDAARNELDAALEKAENAIREKEGELGTLRGRDEKNSELGALEHTMQEVRKQKDELVHELGRLEGRIEYTRLRVAELSKGAHAASDTHLSSESFRLFIERIKGKIDEAVGNGTIDALKECLFDVKEDLAEFFSMHSSGDRVQEELETKKTREDYGALRREKTDREKALGELKEKEDELSRRYREARGKLEEDRGSERAVEQKLFELRSEKNEVVTKREILRVQEEQTANEETHFRDMLEEALHLTGDDVREAVMASGEDRAYDDENIRSEQEARRRKIERIKIKVEEIGIGGEDIIKEHGEISERDAYLLREITDLEKSAQSLKELIAELGEKIDIEFKKGIKQINDEFQKYFVTMFGGGTARLKVITHPPKRKRKAADDALGEIIASSDDEGDAPEDEPPEEEEGIEIAISMPHKRIRGLHALSGGERSLASIALIFAITQTNPPPFLVLDETDAALDETNSRKFSALLVELAKQTQLIIITHNRETMQNAGVLYGVTVAGDSVSRLLSIKLSEAEELVIH